MARWEIWQEQQQKMQQQQMDLDEDDEMPHARMMMGGEGPKTTTTEEITETTYTHAPQELINARKFLCEYSLTQSRHRLERERQRRQGMVRYTRNKKRARLFNRDDDDDDDDNNVVDTIGGCHGLLYTEPTLKGDAKVVKTLDETCEQVYQTIRKLELQGSQYGDVRPLSAICTSSFAGGESIPGFHLESSLMPKLIATGGWSGGIKIWNGGSGNGDDYHIAQRRDDNQDGATNVSSATLEGGEVSAMDLLGAKHIVHEDRIMGIAMRPYLPGGIVSPDALTMVASASIDLTAKLCMVKQNEDKETSNSSFIQVENINIKDGINNNNHHHHHHHHKLRYNIVECSHLRGHAARLCSVAFHPTGKYVATTSFDHTWRLWDVETSSMTNGGTELLLQDGHAREVYGVGFHPDGSLVSTTDFGGVVQCWDLRTGKSACHFVGHAKRVLCCEFAPNGFQLVSAGDDGTIKVWDLRRPRRAATSIPAHTNLITQLKFAHSSSSQNGEFLASSSFDGTGKIWSTRDWKLLSTLRGHEGKVMGIDILDGPRCGIVTCGFDKTLKLWQ